jgi:integrase
MTFPDKVRLTSTGIRTLALPAGIDDRIYWDADLPGFGLRIRAGGSRTWIVQYDLGRKSRRMTLGTTKLLDPGKARETAKDILAAVRLGKDPAGEKATARARVAETFEMAMLGFLEHQRQHIKPRSFVEVERHMRINAKPLHGLELAKIDRRAIAAQLNRLANTAGNVTANRARAVWSAFFNWSAREGLIDSNPAAFTNRRAEASRERVLSDDELRTVWRALPDGDYGDIIRLLILTGQRREEIGALRWSEIDLERGIITLPAARTKNSREHIVPMSVTVRAILEARPRFRGRDLVFGRGDGGFSGYSKCKERLDEKTGITDWLVHDLRRTVATRMAGEPLSIQPHIIEAVINHISGHKGGVHGIYNRATYLPEKRQALDRWADHLTAIVEGRESNVTALRRA